MLKMEDAMINEKTPRFELLNGALLVLLLGSGISACSDSRGSGVDDHRKTLVNDDGTTSFWRGKDIATLLASGKALGGPDDKNVWMNLKVANSWLEKAAEKPSGVSTRSMEQPQADLIEITMRQPKPGGKDGELQTFAFRPGDPFVTGWVQVLNRTDQAGWGGFYLRQWVRGYPNPQTMKPAWGGHIWETGLLPDDDMPVLLYNSYPFKAPLPEHWR